MATKYEIAQNIQELLDMNHAPRISSGGWTKDGLKEMEMKIRELKGVNYKEEDKRKMMDRLSELELENGLSTGEITKYTGLPRDKVEAIIEDNEDNFEVTKTVGRTKFYTLKGY